MPIRIERSGREMVIVRAMGILAKEDFASFTDEFERQVREHGRLRILFDATRFEGWSSTAIWQEFKFDIEHNRDISRLAVVGGKKWQEILVVSLKPFAFAATRYFEESEMTEAQNWLVSGE
ncbi:STAS/SEC14 domain-containing protein [Acidicapsa dinghuensis]|uniref:STAS/SEC14 domain-containing protein n=1 Tax=Acidicapsa dinghuensis TaxID=2218256 RepID=A0ABW1EJY1_9BACT|nr:STAS/SEC14 domain-containing protein [Acidicapsa dinghuensis]